MSGYATSQALTSGSRAPVMRSKIPQRAVNNIVGVSAERFPVRRTPKKGLRQVDFVFERNEIRGLEQNPETRSRWAQMARSGKKVMQFLAEGRYVANVVDGKVTLYRNRTNKNLRQPSVV